MLKRRCMIISLVLMLALIPVLVSASPAWACHQGCTPGYWKNHLDSWVPTGISPGDSFATLFDIVGEPGIDPNLTMLEALQLKGGQFNALFRHAAAGLLNASHPDVAGPGVNQVKTLVKNAVTSGNWEDAKDQLETWNELGCPLC